MNDNPNTSRGPLLDHLDALEALCAQRDPRLRDILGIFGPEGHYVLMLFFILPFLQPIPLFGLSTPFGLLIAVIAVLAFRGKPAWIPARWADRVVQAGTVSRIAEGSERVFEKLGFLLHPRLHRLFQGPFRILNVTLIVLNAVLLALPLPIPFSNAMPAWMILFQALAHLEDDGAFIVASYVQALFSFAYFGFILLVIGAGLSLLG